MSEWRDVSLSTVDSDGLGFSQYGEMGVAVCLGAVERIEAHPEVVESAREALELSGAVGAVMTWETERSMWGPECPNRGQWAHNHVYFSAPLLSTDAPGRMAEVVA